MTLSLSQSSKHEIKLEALRLGPVLQDMIDDDWHKRTNRYQTVYNTETINRAESPLQIKPNNQSLPSDF